MIEHEMLFLGLLIDGPKHGYEIKRKIDEELFPFVGLKVKSIYYPLRKMEKLGLVKKDIGREGKWPEKYIYQITEKGEKIFEHLINESFLSIERPYFNLDLSLYFLEHVDTKLAKRRLKARVIFLKRIKREIKSLLENLKNPKKYIDIILKHDVDLVEAEINSTTTLISALD